MDNLKFILLSIVVCGLVILGGYWAVDSMQSGSEHVNVQKIRTLQAENEELKQEVEKLSAQVSNGANTVATAPTPQEPVKAPEKPVATTPPPVKKPTTTTYKNQTLINELQKLADKGVVLEPGTTGPAVGSVQKFLNVYNKTSNKIDNDYGATTKTKVIAFQKAQGLKADGGVGKTTLLKMVAWLKKQG